MPRYIKLLIRKNCITRFFTGFFPFLSSPASFYLQIKRYICLCSSRLSNFYLHAYFWKMKVYFISFFPLERSLCPSCKVVPGRNIHRIQHESSLIFAHDVSGSQGRLNLFWEGKGRKLFMERFYLFKEEDMEHPYNFSSHIKTENFT